MTLALAIVFLWIGVALLYVAFHPISTDVRTPGDMLDQLRTDMQSQDSAYSL